MKQAVDLVALYRDFNIPTAPPGNKHFRYGWVNTHCPFCSGSKNYHLGYNLSNGYFFCWRCGWKPTKLALSGVLGRDERVAAKLAKDYASSFVQIQKQNDIGPRPDKCPLPRGSKQLLPIMGRYLRDRGFDPDCLVRVWGLLGTDQSADLRWRWRIIIPIYHDRQLVSYTSRALSNKILDKYRACPQKDEVLHHRDTLYGLDKALTDTGVVVEGPADVWRIGPGAVGLFGDQVTPAQRILLRRFRRLFILLDGDDAGRSAGEKIAWQMGGFGLEVRQIILPDGRDPGSLSEQEARDLRQDFGLDST